VKPGLRFCRHVDGAKDLIRRDMMNHMTDIGHQNKLALR
jgi:hypothetical protein